MVDGNRKQVRRSVYGRTIADVQAKLIEIQGQAQGGSLPITRGREPTLAQFAARWLAGMEGHVRPRTLHRYRELLDLHILPTLGRTPLSKASVEHVNQLLATCHRAGLSARTCNYLRGTLRTLLREAERQGLVTRNVAALARPLPQERTETAILTPEQARWVLAAAERDPDGPLWVLGLTTGARLSEMLGLRWSDVDLLEGAVEYPAEAGCSMTIRQTLQETPKALRDKHGRWLVQAAKTERSHRRVPLSQLAVDALRRQRAQQREWQLAAGRRWEDLGLVFTDPLGEPLAATTVTHRWGRRLWRKGRDGQPDGPLYGLPPIKFHAATRHSVASFLLAAGVPMKTVSELLGHSQLATTADVYTHVAETLKREASDAISRVLGG